jgi:O-antigen/teichoic acid export membrane protein
MNSGRLARNTVALFARQFVILGINLYAVRVLLAGLGVNDFALFSVMVNLVAIASFLPASLQMITQRYFAFAIGQEKEEASALKRVHDASLLLCVVVSALTLLGIETVGSWFVAHHLVVHPDRLATAQTLFQLSIVAFVATNFTGFYSSVILANEDMHVYAFFSVAEAVLRLGAALAIGLLVGDGLIIYGLLLCAITIGMVVAYWLFCSRRYPECRGVRLRADKDMLREMSGFAGWTIFGQVTTISRNQAVTVLINQAFSPATVAARALAVQVASQALIFSTNFSAALHPPIIKSHAAGEREQMFSLVFLGAKMAFFLIWMVTLPMLAVMPWVLNLWLGHYPPETVLFTRLALIENAISAISLTLMTAVRATGQVRLYELSLGMLQIMVLLLSWLLVRAEYPAYSVYLVAIAVNLVMFGVRLAIASHTTGLPAWAFLRDVGLPVLLVIAVSSAMVLAVFEVAPGLDGFALHPAALGAVALMGLLPVAVVYALGLSGDERRALHAMIRKRQLRAGAAG